MKTILEIILILFGFSLILGFLFMPLIAVILTGNWWYLFLFFVSWIPAIFAALILKGVIEIIDEF